MGKKGSKHIATKAATKTEMKEISGRKLGKTEGLSQFRVA
jgi:hypothetical protein